MKPLMYLVPSAIAQALQLTPIRRSFHQDGKTMYLLSAPDLVGYGTDRAISEGSTILTIEQAQALCATTEQEP